MAAVAGLLKCANSQTGKQPADVRNLKQKRNEETINRTLLFVVDISIENIN